MSCAGTLAVCNAFEGVGDGVSEDVAIVGFTSTIRVFKMAAPVRNNASFSARVEWRMGFVEDRSNNDQEGSKRRNDELLRAADAANRS